MSIVLNLPIVSLFFKSHPWLHDANKQIRFLKMHYVENLIVTEKSTSITYFELFLKHDVCVLLYKFYGSVFTLVLPFKTENTCMFSSFCPFTWLFPQHASDKYLFISLWS